MSDTESDDDDEDGEDEAEDGKFGLYGRNARGQIDLDLSLERSLAPVSELRPAPSRQQEPAEKPSVLVVE